MGSRTHGRRASACMGEALQELQVASALVQEGQRRMARAMAALRQARRQRPGAGAGRDGAVKRRRTKSGQRGAAPSANEVIEQQCRHHEQTTAVDVRQMEQKLQEKDEAIRVLQDLLRSREDGPAPAHCPQVKEEPGQAQGEEEDRKKLVLKMEEAARRANAAADAPSPLGEALCKACARLSAQDVGRLLDEGADPNYVNADAQTPLLLAIRRSTPSADMVSLLLDRGADPQATSLDCWLGTSPLHLAASRDPSGLYVSLLVSKGARVNARSLNGTTALHYAAAARNELAARALLAAGARKHVKGWDGKRTPFDCVPPSLHVLRNILRP